MYKLVSTIASSFLIGSSSFLQVTKTTIKACMSSNFNQIGILTAELAALERLEKSPWTYNGRNVVTTLVPSFLNESFSFLQGTSTTKQARMFLNFCQIKQLTA